MFALVSQMRRAAVSVPANIAKGFEKRGKPDKVRYMNIAQGSLQECRYYLMLARDLKYCDPASILNTVDQTGRLLGAYSGAIRKSL